MLGNLRRQCYIKEEIRDAPENHGRCVGGDYSIFLSFLGLEGTFCVKHFQIILLAVSLSAQSMGITADGPVGLKQGRHVEVKKAFAG